MHRPLPPVWDVGRHVLRPEGEVTRDDGVWGKAAEGAGRRERQAEEAAGRGDVRHGDPEGCRRKKCMVRPAIARFSWVTHRLAYMYPASDQLAAFGDKALMRSAPRVPD